MGERRGVDVRPKKTVRIIILAAFLAFESSRVSLGGAGEKVRETVQTDISQADTMNVGSRIFNVIKKDGKRILFPEKSPGRFDPATQAVAGVAAVECLFLNFLFPKK
jgi:hypothetical protein